MKTFAASAGGGGGIAGHALTPEERQIAVDLTAHLGAPHTVTHGNVSTIIDPPKPRMDDDLGRMIYIAVEARRVGVSYATMERRLGDGFKFSSAWSKIAGKLLDAVDASVSEKLSVLFS